MDIEEETEKKFVELYQGGMPLREIKKKLGFKSNAQIYYILGKHGLPLRARTVVAREPFVSRVTGNRKKGSKFLYIPTAVQEKVNLPYGMTVRWQIKSYDQILLTLEPPKGE